MAYFFENFESTSTMDCRLFSGWSPGIKEAIAITAERRATNAPTQANTS